MVDNHFTATGIGWFTFAQIKKLKTFDNVIKMIAHSLRYIKQSKI